MRTFVMIVIFGLIGALAGIGESHYYNKSERNTAGKVGLVIGSIFGIFTGIMLDQILAVGNNEQSLARKKLHLPPPLPTKKDKISKMFTRYHLGENGWRGTTSWLNRKSNLNCRVTTLFDSQGNLSSTYTADITEVLSHGKILNDRSKVARLHSKAIQHFLHHNK